MKISIIILAIITNLFINAQSTDSGLIKHIVLFRYKDNIEQNAKMKSLIRKNFLELKNKALKNNAPYIVSISAGYFNGHENAENGLTDGYILTFKTIEDRDYYVGCNKEFKCSEGGFKAAGKEYDRKHDEFKAFVGPLLYDSDGNGPVGDGVIVFDFIAD